MLRLKELRLRLSISALLEGRIAIAQLDLIEPVLALEAGADGKASWNIFIAAGGSAAASSTSRRDRLCSFWATSLPASDSEMGTSAGGRPVTAMPE